MNDRFDSHRGRVALSVVTMAAVATLTSACGSQTLPPAPARDPKAPIGSLGRIEPGEGVVRIAARGLGGQPSIIGTLLVKEGDPVKAGQVLAELNSRDELLAAQSAATAAIGVARTRLAQVKAGAKPADIAAQQAEVERLRFDRDNAALELKRSTNLGDLVSPSQLDAVRLRLDTATQAVQQAERRLVALNEVRPVDVAVATAQLDAAERDAARAQAAADAAVIRSPIDGHVLRIHAWPGEEVGPAGVLEVGVLDPMYAVAEVAEADVARVKVGQRATISGDGLPDPIAGTVERVGRKILQNQVMPLDPATFSDARVVEVRIRVDAPSRVAQLVHLRVNVSIQP